jgi:hypothetical protein
LIASPLKVATPLALVVAVAGQRRRQNRDEA